IGDVGYAFGHANAEVDDAVGLEFKRCAPRNNFALGQFPGGIVPVRARISPLNVGSYSTENVCQWCSRFARTTQSTKTPGILTCLGLREPRSAIRSTCAITRPPELRTAIA